MLTTSTAIVRLQNFTNGRAEFRRRDLATKADRFTFVAGRGKKKGRREGNEAASSSFASSRLLNHSLAH